jgi:hypothetical protein
VTILSFLRILAIVLITVGAFFKIEHLEGANALLLAGLATALVWLLVYGYKIFGRK